MLGACLPVQLVNVLSDDHNAPSLLAQTLLALRDGDMGWIGMFAQHQFPPVVVEFPHTGGVSCKSPWSSQLLQKDIMDHSTKEESLPQIKPARSLPFVLLPESQGHQNQIIYNQMQLIKSIIPQPFQG